MGTGVVTLRDSSPPIKDTTLRNNSASGYGILFGDPIALLAPSGISPPDYDARGN